MSQTMTDFLAGFLCGAVAFVPIPFYAAFTRTARNAVERSAKTRVAIYSFGPLWFALFIGGLILLQTVTERMGVVTRDRFQIAFFGYILGMWPSVLFFGWQELAWRKKNPRQHPPPQRTALSIPALCAIVGIVVVGVLAQKNRLLEQVTSLDALRIARPLLVSDHGEHFSKTQEMT
jgi:hypothetical protein